MKPRTEPKVHFQTAKQQKMKEFTISLDSETKKYKSKGNFIFEAVEYRKIEEISEVVPLLFSLFIVSKKFSFWLSELV